MSGEHTETLLAAAAVLEGGDDPGRGSSFLGWLMADNPQGIRDQSDLVSLLRFGSRLDRVFELPVPDAPGLFAFGAELSAPLIPAGATGRIGSSGLGRSRLEAFRSCIAEAAEHASQYGAPGWLDSAAVLPVEEVRSGPFGEFLDFSGVRGSTIPMIPGATLDNREVLAPAALCYRNRPTEGPHPRYRIGVGCAAGRSREEAVEHAFLELAERDAVAHWWIGHRRARPISAEAMSASGVAGLVSTARQAREGRQSWFLDISTELGVPVTVAVSFDDGGRAFAFGFGAGRSLPEALTSAFLELCQIELADHVVEAKRREAGDAALNDVDRLHLRRRSSVHADFDLLHPTGPPVRHRTIESLRTVFDGRGMTATLVDHTSQDIDVAVVRAICTDLQPFPADFKLESVTRELEANKNSLRNHCDVPLA